MIVVGCKMDKRDREFDLSDVLKPLMQQFREIETGLECSAQNNVQVRDTGLLVALVDSNLFFSSKENENFLINYCL